VIKRASKQLRSLCPSGTSQEDIAIRNPHPELIQSLGDKKSCEAAILDTKRLLNYARCSPEDPLFDICCEKCLMYRLNNCTSKTDMISDSSENLYECYRLNTCEDFVGKNPCFNDGTCVSDYGLSDLRKQHREVLVAFKCICKRGFKGDNILKII